MSITARQLSSLYKNSHDQMRNIDGLQPQEAFDELLKYLFVKESSDEADHHFPPCIPPILNQGFASNNEALVKDLRLQLKTFLIRANSWSNELWPDRTFHLSDSALLSVHELFEHIDFASIGIDIRSAALNEFIPSELRRGLGIFPTPDPVARMMVEVLSPPVSSRVYDPACGTGTFLVELIRKWLGSHANVTNHSVWGVDKSPRMLLLSELNLGHNNGITFRRALADSLYQSPTSLFEGIKEGFDYILTNPPFGVVIDRNKHDMTSFETCRSYDGNIVKRQQSEVLFVEQCIKYLRPGGALGIVLPRSVVTNSSLAAARQTLNRFGYLEAIVNLPPETFSTTGTQTNTVVLFIRRYTSSTERGEAISVACADVDNVGFDSTGRPREGNQLENIPKALLSAANATNVDNSVRLLSKVTKGQSITTLPSLLAERLRTPRRNGQVPLGELVDVATNGKTPARSNYSVAGLFLVKVGNLTGRGIDWLPRDRNFISGPEEHKRMVNPRLMLRKNDILLTSSAHSPVYIAKKVDIVTAIPEWLGGKASFVGEVLMLRLNYRIDPVILLAYLRLPSVQRQVQWMIRGQTAHLHPADFLDLRVPKALLEPPTALQSLADNIKVETQLSERMNKLLFEQRAVLSDVERALIV